MARYYLTTAIDYSNGVPHLGHAFEKIGADVIARYRRGRGDDVHFVIGMDEHGQKVAREAEARGLDPREWVDGIAEEFRDAWDRLDISHDDFIRTTEARHHRGVRALLERIREAGDFYLSSYEGYYCTGCEAFKKEEELEEGRCPLHPGREIEWTEEENFFFRLSRYTDRLLEHVREQPEFIRPESRRNEILRLLEDGLEDISASRSRLPWGVPFPGAEDHTAYVWFDALPNYITAIGYPDPGHERWWPARLHVIGKDITRFHCLVWPAMLLSAGLELPGTVWAHGFVNVGGGKLSKSAGERMRLPELVDRHGPDALRFFLMREVPWHADRDFPSAEAFLEGFDRRYESELADDLGNLLNRVVSMVLKYRDGRVPVEGAATALDRERQRAAAAYHEAMEGHLLHEGLEAVFALVRAANGYVDGARPWDLARREREAEAGSGPGAAAGEPAAGGSEAGADAAAELDAVLGSLVRALGTCAAWLSPFMPTKAAELWAGLGGAAGETPSPRDLEDRLAGLRRARRGPVLFPKEDAGS